MYKDDPNHDTEKVVAKATPPLLVARSFPANLPGVGGPDHGIRNQWQATANTRFRLRESVLAKKRGHGSYIRPFN